MNKLRFRRTGQQPLKATGWVLASDGKIIDGRATEVHIARTSRDKYVIAIACHSCYSSEGDWYHADRFNSYEDAIGFLRGYIEPAILDGLIEQMEYK